MTTGTAQRSGTRIEPGRQRRPAFSSRELRQAMSRFATGVVVITAQTKQGENIGVTVNSFSSVSLDPPLALFCIDNRVKSLPALSEARGFVINVLAQHQTRISGQFARSLGEKWQAVDFASSRNGAPVLVGAIAHFECEPYAIHDGGDHRIFVVEITGLDVAAHDEPLIFYGGNYRKLERSIGTDATWPLPIHY